MTALRATAPWAVYVVAYAGAYALGIELYFEPEVVASLWPASGLYLSALVLAPSRAWPAVAALSFAVHLALGLLLYGGEPAVDGAFAAAATVEALVGAALLRRLFGRRLRVGRFPHLVGLLGAGALSTATGALVGAAGVLAANPDAVFLSVWQLWWFADLLGVVLVAPLVLSWAGERRRWPTARLLELGALFVLLLAAGQRILGGDVGPARSILDFPYLVLLFWMVIAIRFDPRESALAGMAVALLAAWHADRGNGPFRDAAWSVHEEVLSLQAFLAVASVTMLVLSALVSERRRAEREVTEEREGTAEVGRLGQLALRESEARYRALVEHSSEAIVVFDVDRGTFVEANGRAVELFGYARDELLTRGPVDLSPPLQPGGTPSAELAAREVRRALEGESPTFEWVHRTADGRDVPCEIWLARYPSEGRLVRGSIYDVTERKEIEEAREQQRRELVRADKMMALGTLVAGVAHEVSNPNHFIMLNMPVLRDVWRDVLPILDEEHARNPDLRLGNMPYGEVRGEIGALIEEVCEGADRIKHIVDELRGYARGQDSRPKGPVSLNEVVRAALTLLAAPIRTATARFSVQYAPDLPPVVGSIRRLEQVVINLVLNACESLPDRQGGVSVRTGLDSERDEAFVEVADEGAGIPGEDLPHITDPFYTTRRERGGTGVGLAVAARIVEEHSGRLSYDSTVGEGTTVRMSLPLRPAEDGVVAAGSVEAESVEESSV